MAPTSETQPSERLERLEDHMRRMHDDLNARLDAVEESRADDEDTTLAAERTKSGAAERTRDGAEALAELGIHPY